MARDRETSRGLRVAGTRRALTLVAVAAVGVTGAVLTTAGPAYSASPGCGYGSGGPFDSAICWVDLSSFSSTIAGSPAGQPMTVDLAGGATLSFTAHLTPGPGGQVSLSPMALPTWTQAALGRAVYLHVPGKPALNALLAGNGEHLVLTDIVVRIDGTPQPAGYTMVLADAESTNVGEGLVFSADTPLQLLASVQPAGSAPPCGGGLTGVGTTTVTCRGAGAGAVGADLFRASAPTQVGAELDVGGGQAVAFGILLSQVSASVSATDRLAAADSFTVTSTVDGVLRGSTTTGTAGTASTGSATLLADPGTPATVVFDGAMAAGSTATWADYTTAWSCSRNGSDIPAGDLTVATDGSSVTVPVDAGDRLSCALAVTVPAAHLTVAAHPSSDTATRVGDTVTTDYLVTNDGAARLTGLTLTMAAFTGAGPAPIPHCPSTTLAPGATMTCTATYQPTQADMDAGSVTTTVVGQATPSGADTPLTFAPATVTLTMARAPGIHVQTEYGTPVDTNRDGVLSPGDRSPVSFVVTNTGNTTLTGLVILDPLDQRPATCPQPSLAPGATMTCTGPPHVVSAAELVTSVVPAGTTGPAGSASRGSSPALAYTGEDLTGPGRAAGALIGLGALLVLATRRRRSSC